ncbi:cysteine-rich DPF motif domain-containing protein 1-like [Actinia tenebrosa]|uniref:Cysteine-rich DPF motif domain-containing protein 1 n=1 Tax=Actinia tenebrosa TaxID=6105 RepID=A0A6P8IBC3_ACTTE|nr:cysteine-rich DPF motif domain-containing protein 1-like [Actinia tenebrosa]
MEDRKNTEKTTFKCSLCDFTSRYDYYGRNPPFSKSIVLLEDAYLIQDPFSPTQSHLTIGSNCTLCSADVCVGQNCSIFYTKRFCIPCVKKNITEFPDEIKTELNKR